MRKCLFNDPRTDKPPEEYLINFIFMGIGIPLVSVFGLVGNILSIVVLWQSYSRYPIIHYFIALAISDIGILLSMSLCTGPIALSRYLKGTEALDYWSRRVYPFIFQPCAYAIRTSQQLNVLTTIAISVERCLAIRRPFGASNPPMRSRTTAVIAIIVVVSLLYNIPHLLAFSHIECAIPHGINDTNISVSLPVNQTPPEIIEVYFTDFGRSEGYKTFRTNVYAVVILFIPSIILIISNTIIFKELMSVKYRLSPRSDDITVDFSFATFLIVAIFLLCQTPKVLSTFESIVTPDILDHWLAVANFLFTINSTVNFLIYTAYGRKFRKTLLRLFWCCKSSSKTGGPETSTSLYKSKASGGITEEQATYRGIYEETENNVVSELSIEEPSVVEGKAIIYDEDFTL